MRTRDNYNRLLSFETQPDNHRNQNMMFHKQVVVCMGLASFASAYVMPFLPQESGMAVGVGNSPFGGGGDTGVDNAMGGFMNVLADYQDSGGDVVMECMTGISIGFLLGLDPVTAALDKFNSQNYCQGKETETFQNAMDEFETCSGYSINTLTETFFGALVGTSLHCAKYMYDTFNNIANTLAFGVSTTIDLPMARMPDECVEALFGDNPFGNALRMFIEFPEQDTHCFSKLATELPDCTLNQWPIPIVGMYLQAVACAYGNAIPILEESCTRELQALKECLPSGEYSADYQCTKAIQDCANAELESMALENLFTSPPPLLGRPLSDTCLRVAKSQPELRPALTKYKAFQGYCVAAEDKAIWSIQPKNTLQTTVSMASQVESLSAVSTKTVVIRSGGGAKLFFVGILLGAVASMLGMIAYRRSHGDRSPTDRSGRYTGVELA